MEKNGKRMPMKFRKSGRCEMCKEKWRQNTLDQFGRHSKNYYDWIEHNKEAQKGFGAELCWHCYRYGSNPSIKARKNFYKECRPTKSTSPAETPKLE